jgi:hypothetical protein
MMITAAHAVLAVSTAGGTARTSSREAGKFSWLTTRCSFELSKWMNPDERSLAESGLSAFGLLIGKADADLGTTLGSV